MTTMFQSAVKPLRRLDQRTREIRGSNGFIVSSMSLAVFTDIYLYSTIIPVVPFAFIQRFGVHEKDVQKWTTIALALYSAGLVVGALLFGWLGDKVKRRKDPMMGGLIVLLAATFLLCFANNMAAYIAGRVLQGISGGIVWTVGLAIITDVTPPERLAFVLSFPAIATTLGVVLGPVLGGIVYDKAGYYPVFIVCFAVLSFDIVLRLLMIETIKDHDTSVSLLDDSCDATGEPKKSNVRIFLAKNMPSNFLLLANYRFLNALLQTVAMAWFITALDATLSLHLKDNFGFSSLKAGLVFLAIGGAALADPLIGAASDKYGPRFVIASGFTLMGPVFILFRIPNHDNTGDIALLMVLLVLIGLGLSLIMTPVMAEITVVVAKIDARYPGRLGRGRGFGQAYGYFNVAFAVGSLIGPFEAGPVRTKYGWARETLSLGIISLIMVIPTLFLTGGNIIVHRQKRKAMGSSADGNNVELEDTASSVDGSAVTAANNSSTSVPAKNQTLQSQEVLG